MQDFVQSARQVPIVGHLLSMAERLCWAGHRRTALIEAVSALEVTLNLFAAEAEGQKPVQCKDVPTGFSNLKKDIEHLGLTGSMNYLLPLILNEGVVSQEDLESCQRAINDRGNIVHNGQRDVQLKTLLRYLRGIRSLCEAIGAV